MYHIEYYFKINVGQMIFSSKPASRKILMHLILFDPIINGGVFQTDYPNLEWPLKRFIVGEGVRKIGAASGVLTRDKAVTLADTLEEIQVFKNE